MFELRTSSWGFKLPAIEPLLRQQVRFVDQLNVERQTPNAKRQNAKTPTVKHQNASTPNNKRQIMANVERLAPKVERQPPNTIF